MAAAQDNVESLQDIVSTPGDFTPGQLAKIRAQLAAARQKLSQLTNQLNGAVASSQQAHGQLAAVNAQLGGADLAIQQAQIRVTNLSGSGKNPAFGAAKQAAEAAAAQYRQLLDQYRQEFLLPRAVDQGALESVAAINVVDGLGLLKLRDEQAIPFGKKGLPAQGTAKQVELSAELDALAGTVDAVGDALMAETVYQAVRGNPLRAASTVEAVAGGETPPPELEIARTPRTGVALTHRMVTLFSGDPQLPPEWATRPRCRALPRSRMWTPGSAGCSAIRVGSAASSGSWRLKRARSCPCKRSAWPSWESRPSTWCMPSKEVATANLLRSSSASFIRSCGGPAASPRARSCRSTPAEGLTGMRTIWVMASSANCCGRSAPLITGTRGLDARRFESAASHRRPGL